MLTTTFGDLMATTSDDDSNIQQLGSDLRRRQ
uniref:Uncharacterized protein n=1 Tax=Arundo donax TaxID=35708 RepID=A0A0A9GKS4_ARUDO